MHLKLCTVLATALTLGSVTQLGANDIPGVPFPQKDQGFYLTLPEGWYLDNDDDEAWDLRPQVSVPKGPKTAADHVVVKIGLLADAKTTDSLTWEDLRDGLEDLAGDTVDELVFEDPEMVQQVFTYGHLAAQGKYQLAPSRGKTLYVDAYFFRPDGAQVQDVDDLLPGGNGRLFSVIFFTNDDSEKKWGKDMDKLFDSFNITPP